MGARCGDGHTSLLPTCFRSGSKIEDELGIGVGQVVRFVEVGLEKVCSVEEMFEREFGFGIMGQVGLGGRKGRESGKNT